MLSYTEALKIIKENFNLLQDKIVEVRILDSVNHILAENVYADINMPPFDNSAVDGYGVNYNSEIEEWELIGEESAGNYIDIFVDEKSTVNIMTGGQVPNSCTTVVPLEDVIIEKNRVKLKNDVSIHDGMNIRRLGENIRRGDLAISKNTMISTHKISLLAACGKSKVKVYKPLKVGVLSTGDELVDVNKVPTGDKIRATNLYSIIALLKKYHFESVNLGFVNDDRNKILKKVREALDSDIDILLTTGGVSVGKYDYLKEIFEELRVERKFWRAFIKPGKPIYFGTYNGNEKLKLVFGLAGNPVSSFVNYYVYLLPAFESKFGIQLTEKFNAKLLTSIKKKDAKRHFIRGEFGYSFEENCFEVKRAGSQSSGNMVGLSDSNCLMIFEEEKRMMNKGEIVECIRI